jgi:hypothetical protein
MSTQRYTPEFKEEAVRQVVERGYPVQEVAAKSDCGDRMAALAAVTAGIKFSVRLGRPAGHAHNVLSTPIAFCIFSPNRDVLPYVMTSSCVARVMAT